MSDNFIIPIKTNYENNVFDKIMQTGDNGSEVSVIILSSPKPAEPAVPTAPDAPVSRAPSPPTAPTAPTAPAEPVSRAAQSSPAVPVSRVAQSSRAVPVSNVAQSVPATLPSSRAVPTVTIDMDDEATAPTAPAEPVSRAAQSSPAVPVSNVAQSVPATLPSSRAVPTVTIDMDDEATVPDTIRGYVVSLPDCNAKNFLINMLNDTKNDQLTSAIIYNPNSRSDFKLEIDNDSDIFKLAFSAKNKVINQANKLCNDLNEVLKKRIMLQISPDKNAECDALADFLSKLLNGIRQKCKDLLSSPTDAPSVPVARSLFGGGDPYYAKYLKYKNKYLVLKKKIA